MSTLWRNRDQRVAEMFPGTSVDHSLPEMQKASQCTAMVRINYCSDDPGIHSGPLPIPESSWSGIVCDVLHNNHLDRLGIFRPAEEKIDRFRDISVDLARYSPRKNHLKAEAGRSGD